MKTSRAIPTLLAFAFVGVLFFLYSGFTLSSEKIEIQDDEFALTQEIGGVDFTETVKDIVHTAEASSTQITAEDSETDTITPKIEEPLNDTGDRPLKRATTTIFWVGESEDQSNNFISNAKSAWDTSWEEHFGGIDDPLLRCGFLPCSFTPHENPFYIALPYTDFGSDGKLKISAKNIPWYEAVEQGISVVKNRWVKVVHEENECYGQWEDVGPNESDDFEYVFGTSLRPVNTFNTRAGLDISPALRDCLGVAGISVTHWGFVEQEEVPSGPWFDIVTNSPVDW